MIGFKNSRWSHFILFLESFVVCLVVIKTAICPPWGRDQSDRMRWPSNQELIGQGRRHVQLGNITQQQEKRTQACWERLRQTANEINQTNIPKRKKKEEWRRSREERRRWIGAAGVKWRVSVAPWPPDEPSAKNANATHDLGSKMARRSNSKSNSNNSRQPAKSLSFSLSLSLFLYTKVIGQRLFSG